MTAAKHRRIAHALVEATSAFARANGRSALYGFDGQFVCSIKSKAEAHDGLGEDKYSWAKKEREEWFWWYSPHAPLAMRRDDD